LAVRGVPITSGLVVVKRFHGPDLAGGGDTAGLFVRCPDAGSSGQDAATLDLDVA